MNLDNPNEASPMPPAKTTRFDFAKPSAHVTRAIVIRGKGRFAIVRPDPAPPAVISRKDLGKLGDTPLHRTGGLPMNRNANEEFEAGMQFGQDLAA